MHTVSNNQIADILHYNNKVDQKSSNIRRNNNKVDSIETGRVVQSWPKYMRQTLVLM